MNMKEHTVSQETVVKDDVVTRIPNSNHENLRILPEKSNLDIFDVKLSTLSGMPK